MVEELVVEAAVAVGSAAVVSLAGVIEDDVEDDLDAGLVEGLAIMVAGIRGGWPPGPRPRCGVAGGFGAAKAMLL